MSRNSGSCLLSLCVFSMPGIMLCKQISAEFMRIGLGLKHETMHVGRYVSSVSSHSSFLCKMRNVEGDSPGYVL